MDDPEPIGEVYIYRFSEVNPDAFPPVPNQDTTKTDLFIVYSNGNPIPCIWGEGSFWHRWGETDADYHIVLNVEYWFRVPRTIMELIT